ncbi:MAG: MarR family transcriptional regulator [Xanthomonadales bacterium]|nr:MarR family transcriptional regulator [Xanthomonadales bacterium]
MLDTTQVLAKTDLGRDAISKRSHGLNPRQRAVLISINGELSVGDLRARFGAGKEAELEVMLDHLLEHGLVERTRAEPAAAAPAPVAMVDAQPATSVAPAVVAPGAALPASAPALQSGLDQSPDWRVLRDRAGALLHQMMGEDADLLAMRLERSRTESEFMDHLERSFAVVESARGHAAMASYRAGILSAAA